MNKLILFIFLNVIVKYQLFKSSSTEDCDSKNQQAWIKDPSCAQIHHIKGEFNLKDTITKLGSYVFSVKSVQDYLDNIIQMFKVVLGGLMFGTSLLPIILFMHYQIGILNIMMFQTTLNLNTNQALVSLGGRYASNLSGRNSIGNVISNGKGIGAPFRSKCLLFDHLLYFTKFKCASEFKQQQEFFLLNYPDPLGMINFKFNLRDENKEDSPYEDKDLYVNWQCDCTLDYKKVLAKVTSIQASVYHFQLNDNSFGIKTGNNNANIDDQIAKIDRFKEKDLTNQENTSIQSPDFRKILEFQKERIKKLPEYEADQIGLEKLTTTQFEDNHGKQKLVLMNKASKQGELLEAMNKNDQITFKFKYDEKTEIDFTHQFFQVESGLRLNSQECDWTQNGIQAFISDVQWNNKYEMIEIIYPKVGIKNELEIKKKLMSVVHTMMQTMESFKNCFQIMNSYDQLIYNQQSRYDEFKMIKERAYLN